MRACVCADAAAVTYADDAKCAVVHPTMCRGGSGGGGASSK